MTTPSFLKRAAQYLGLRKDSTYCQLCGDNLTETGGMVTSTRKIYCNRSTIERQDPCFTFARLHEATADSQGRAGMLFGDYYTPAQVQRAIAFGELKYFGELERKVQK